MNSLIIDNYRSIKHLELKNLKKINLITGKNNTGKTSIREAIYILMSNKTQQTIYETLLYRKEIFIRGSSEDWKHIFNGRTNNLYKDMISIKSDVKSLELTLVPYTDSYDKYNRPIKSIMILPEDLNNFENYLIGLQINTGDGNKPIMTQGFVPEHSVDNGVLIHVDIPNTSCKFIRTVSDSQHYNSKLWDNISLVEDKEKFVVSALQIIDPMVEKLTFKGDTYRRAFVKLKNISLPVPIGNMGDGMNRILTIILALVNCDNRVLLIDEFENGLHFSVQAKLWEIISSLSRELNVQIFATTHSHDCISAFSEVIDDSRGQCINLVRSGEIINATIINSEKLSFAMEHNIEIR